MDSEKFFKVYLRYDWRCPFGSSVPSGAPPGQRRLYQMVTQAFRCFQKWGDVPDYFAPAEAEMVCSALCRIVPHLLRVWFPRIPPRQLMVNFPPENFLSHKEAAKLIREVIKPNAIVVD